MWFAMHFFVNVYDTKRRNGHQGISVTHARTHTQTHTHTTHIQAHIGFFVSVVLFLAVL